MLVKDNYFFIVHAALLYQSFSVVFYQWWNVTKYIYSSTVLKYKLEVFFTPLHLTALVTLQIKVFAHKTYEELMKYDVLL